MRRFRQAASAATEPSILVDKALADEAAVNGLKLPDW